MNTRGLLCDIDARGIARVTMNRPDLRNAFNTHLIDAIRDAVKSCSDDKQVRAIVLTGAGKTFSAGADLNMMKEAASFSEDENIAQANRLADMLMTIYRSPKPVIAVVNGPALGGGVGVIAACNIAIAADTAFFALSEARLGLIPAAISPFVIRAIGARQAERYFLTGERFSAETAQALGLLHVTTPAETLESKVDAMIDELLRCGPAAQSECKRLINAVAGGTIDAPLMQEVATRIARVRASPEGQEGITAFLDKRRPAWTEKNRV